MKQVLRRERVACTGIKVLINKIDNYLMDERNCCCLSWYYEYITKSSPTDMVDISDVYISLRLLKRGCVYLRRALQIKLINLCLHLEIVVANEDVFQLLRAYS
jgi:hypothetical protein